MVRTVQCVKLGKELPGLEQPPFPGEQGERIYAHVSAEAYALWLPHMTTIINHFGLNPAEPETRRMLRTEMNDFFFGGETRETGELTPEDVRQT